MCPRRVSSSLLSPTGTTSKGGDWEACPATTNYGTSARKVRTVHKCSQIRLMNLNASAHICLNARAHFCLNASAHICLNAHGLTFTWMHELTFTWMHGLTFTWMHGLTFTWMHGLTFAWMHGFTFTWMHGLTFTWIHGLTFVCIHGLTFTVTRGCLWVIYSWLIDIILWLCMACNKGAARTVAPGARVYTSTSPQPKVNYILMLYFDNNFGS